jgi:hypothetical protein
VVWKRYFVGCYYFPNYHVDPRNEAVHGTGWTEWQLVRHALPRYPGHRQPKKPLWGFVDEADPAVMEMKIAAAADHGIDFWIFDWYWYDDGPFLARCLEKGYLGAANCGRVRFCCMWANHDWMDIHPAKMGADAPLLYPGRVSAEVFDRMTHHLLAEYFTHPAYFVVDGCPYFSVYDLGMLVSSFGGVIEARAALDRFRDKARAAGFADLHMNAVVWGRAILPGESTPAEPGRLVRHLGFDSVTSYVWTHHAHLDGPLTTPYEAVFDQYLAYWEKAKREHAVPYFPNVTMGWDSTPRTVMSDTWAPDRYPYTPVITGNTPQAFRMALATVKGRLDDAGGPHLLNINCWNEWTEGSYLEPDTMSGTAYLEAVRDVFGCDTD